MVKFILTLLALVSATMIYSQIHKGTYEEIERLYAHKKENDTTALVFVNRLLYLAKQERVSKRLVYAYEDALYFSPNVEHKLLYADSCITASKLLGDDNLIAKSYLGKGIVHYFNQRDYRAALSQYLIAHRYLEKSKDAYLQHKLLYHIGVVKSYLGYYDESKDALTTTAIYFENQIKNSKSANLNYNAGRGYLNSLHQLMIVERLQLSLKKVDSLYQCADAYLSTNKGIYDQEQAYLLTEKGILSYYHKDYQSGILQLESAYKTLKPLGDLAANALIYMYLSRCYEKQVKTLKALHYAKKVDSVFSIYQYVIPEIRLNYEFLISEAISRGDRVSLKYYTKQLIKADSIIVSDFPQLASRINTQYSMLKNTDGTDSISQINRYFMFFWLVFLGLLFAYVKRLHIVVFRKSLVVSSAAVVDYENKEDKDVSRKYDYSEEVVSNILGALEKFELNKGFLDASISLSRLAKIVKANNTHLSYVLNEHKKTRFYDYIKILRISYITNLLETESKFLNYTIEALAKEAGITSRQTFSKQFYEINGIRPIDFIKKRKRDLMKGT